jgi:hypothetical protein
MIACFVINIGRGDIVSMAGDESIQRIILKAIV